MGIQSDKGLVLIWLPVCLMMIMRDSGEMCVISFDGDDDRLQSESHVLPLAGHGIFIHWLIIGWQIFEGRCQCPCLVSSLLIGEWGNDLGGSGAIEQDDDHAIRWGRWWWWWIKFTLAFPMSGQDEFLLHIERQEVAFSLSLYLHLFGLESRMRPTELSISYAQLIIRLLGWSIRRGRGCWWSLASIFGASMWPCVQGGNEGAGDMSGSEESKKRYSLPS